MDKKLCNCGCGTQINSFDKRGRERFYVSQHQPKNHGKKLTKEWKSNISKGCKGKTRSKKTRLKLSANNKGEKCRFWKGGVYKFRDHLRDNFEYRQWRSDVFTRDDFTCQKCFIRGGQLHVHHIKHFSQIIEDNNIQSLEEAKVCQELWNINNGITLCETCHKQEHKKML